MENGDTEKYHPSRVIQDFVFLSQKRGCIRCISLQVYNKKQYHIYIVLSTENAVYNLSSNSTEISEKKMFRFQNEWPWGKVKGQLEFWCIYKTSVSLGLR